MRAAENQSVVEKVVYTPSIEHPGQTVAVRSAWIDSQVFGFSRAIRAFGVERFKKNCNKMVSIVYYWFVDNLLNYLVQWRWFELLRSYLSTFFAYNTNSTNYKSEDLHSYNVITFEATVKPP